MQYRILSARFLPQFILHTMPDQPPGESLFPLNAAAWTAKKFRSLPDNAEPPWGKNTIALSPVLSYGVDCGVRAKPLQNFTAREPCPHNRGRRKSERKKEAFCSLLC